MKKEKPIKQSVINTFERVGIPYIELLANKNPKTAENRFTGESCQTSALIAYLIGWVYKTNNQYDNGEMIVNTQDFDRIRYFVAEQDQNAYSLCLD